ncbi:parallel beta-helix repeat (two copies) [Candidatus Nitrososphaera evergladensis SR1]|uniref:Parallel beta-helix repeat (Two copies) n=1 Tax=Candidatus Nitrososphaera evergladensis SR1 TaxID=1459636 RepID=A0A075MTK9_9ARCH|nr:right-handed parallel beta-helix repeat-containing protein [Candidatus Nitrososphaera evergladensis]AIF84453.1 parallel beta-helix repeat (two copies) [Candidatus Nitrososphaera evergladensis SR1]
MKYTSVLLCALLASTFGIVIWNMYLPVSSNRNAEFIDYLGYSAKKAYNNNDFLKNNITPIATQLGLGPAPPLPNVGPRILYDPSMPSTVTLTFYVQYGNQENLLPLLDLLQNYNVSKAVFFIEDRFLKEHDFVAKRIQDQGYVIKTWDDLSGYKAAGYLPSVYRGVPLVENEILGQTGRDRDAMEFIRVALRHADSSVIAFSPKIMAHKIVLEDVLKQDGKGIVFSDQPAAAASPQQPSDSQVPPLVLISDGNNSATRVNEGKWTMDLLSKQYPSAVRYNEQESAYLVTRPIIMGNNTTLEINGVRVLLLSSSERNPNPTYLEIRGNAAIANSTVTSWDPVRARPEIDPYIPRPYIVVRGGHMDVLNSTITHLGYSLGGLKDTRYAHAALEYYNAKDFVVANSTIAFNYYGFYSEDSSDFRILNNEIYGQTRYGLDPHTRSVNFVVDSNNVHDNGNQGIICSLWCNNVTITNNIVEYNVEGIGLHWLTNSSIVKDNVVRFNEKYGVFIQKESYNNSVENNIIVGNKYGVGILEGSSRNTVANNVVADNVLERFRIDADSTGNTMRDNRYSVSAG